MKKLKILACLLICFSVFGVAFASGTLTKNLYQGIKDAEVVTLQKFLNSSPDTIVATSDAGSVGNETDYFGSKTKDAVIRFQNKYASEILFPFGLSYGNGYVGILTRQKINSLLSIPVSVATTTSVSTSTVPVITKISPEVINDGEILTIYGTGFTDKNTVFFSIEPPDKYSNIVSTSSGTMISLPINTLLGEKVITGFQKNLSHLSSSARGQAIEKILTGYRKDNNQKESAKREMVVPAILRVENENGKSENMNVNINIFKEVF